MTQLQNVQNICTRECLRPTLCYSHIRTPWPSQTTPPYCTNDTTQQPRFFLPAVWALNTIFFCPLHPSKSVQKKRAGSASLGARILGQPLRSRTLGDGPSSPCSADLGCWRKWRVHAASRNQTRRISHRESAALREFGVTETTSPRGREGGQATPIIYIG